MGLTACPVPGQGEGHLDRNLVTAVPSRSVWAAGAQEVRWQYTVSGGRLPNTKDDAAAPVSPS